jgi:hypothetical protein
MQTDRIRNRKIESPGRMAVVLLKRGFGGSE